MTENLNPGIDAGRQAAMKAKVVWEMAPTNAVAYIATCVEHDGEVSTHGCWVIDPERDAALPPVLGPVAPRRKAAPHFDITELLPTQSFILRREQPFWHPYVMERLHGLFQHVIDRQNGVLLLPPDPNYRRPKYLHGLPLAYAVGMAVEVEATAARVRAKRLQLQAKNGERA